jgi:hypothetical protein
MIHKNSSALFPAVNIFPPSHEGGFVCCPLLHYTSIME